MKKILNPGCRYKIFIASFLFVCSVSGCAKTGHASPELSPGWHNASIRHDGLQRHFRYFLPANFSENAPVVILLHGGTQSMDKIFRRKAGGSKEWISVAEENGILLLVPNGVNPKTGNASGNKQNWNDCRVPIEGTGSASSADDVGFIRRLIDRTKQKFNIDEKRVYATGASNGGLMSFRLATEASDKIAAVAAFIANEPVKSECTAPTRSIPVMIVNGTEDPFMPWEGGMIKGNSGHVVSTEETLKHWLKVNQLSRIPSKKRDLPNSVKIDGSKVIKKIYLPKTEGKEIWFYKVAGGGHTVPSKKHLTPRFLQKNIIGRQNRDIESAREAWKFFLRHRLFQQ